MNPKDRKKNLEISFGLGSNVPILYLSQLAY